MGSGPIGTAATGLESGQSLGGVASTMANNAMDQSPFLKALNAVTGTSVPHFGDSGQVDPAVDTAALPQANPLTSLTAPQAQTPSQTPTVVDEARGGNQPQDMRQGILDAASSLGIDPADLATAISYETAGTFDPTKVGPRTQWGQHRGLIQFGEPQAQKYGVDWKNPIGSQLGREGAVVKYLRDAGVKPGMGMMDIYSAINAGGVGRPNASDANNGGAPGTVADKVNTQMAGHRQKAMALLGREFSPSAQSTVTAQATRPTQLDAMGKPIPQMNWDTVGVTAQPTGEKPSTFERVAGVLLDGKGGKGAPKLDLSSGASSGPGETGQDYGEQDVASVNGKLQMQKQTPGTAAQRRKAALEARLRYQA